MPSFIAAVVEAWSLLAAPLAERGFTSTIKQSSAVGKAVIELEGPHIVASIEVWEDGHSLDTTLHHLSSPHGSILAGGRCESHADVVARLSALQAALLRASE
jgi:hypothetical protein